MGDHSSEKLRFDVYTVCLVYADKLPKGYNFCNESPEAPKQPSNRVTILLYFKTKIFSNSFKTLKRKKKCIFLGPNKSKAKFMSWYYL